MNELPRIFQYFDQKSNFIAAIRVPHCNTFEEADSGSPKAALVRASSDDVCGSPAGEYILNANRL